MALHAWIQSGKLIKNSGGIVCVAEDHPCGPCENRWWCIVGDTITGTGSGDPDYQCVLRTQKEINELVAQGYTLSSGPHNTEEECEANCIQVDLIETTCCPGTLPSILTATITNKTGDCTCVPDEVTLTYISGFWVSDELCGTGMVFRFSCTDVPLAEETCEDFNFEWVNCSLPGSSSPDAGCSCSPLLASFSGLSLGTCCGAGGGTVDVVITE